MKARYELSAEHIESGQDPHAGSLVALRLWLAGSPWRLAGTWLVLAGLVATAGLRVQTVSLVTVLLAVLLADPVWSALWAQVAERSVCTDAGLNDSGWPRLPYAAPDGPLEAKGLTRALVRDVGPLLLVAALISALIGTSALVCTGVVVLLSLVGWTSRMAGQIGWYRWQQVCVQILVPFVLGILLAGAWPPTPLGSWLAGLAVAAALLARASLANRDGEAGALIYAGLGSVIIVVVLMLARLPLAAGLASLVALGPLLLLTQRRAPRSGLVDFWWWLLLVLVAAALGLGLG